MKWCIATVTSLSLAGFALASAQASTHAEVYALSDRSKPSNKDDPPHIPRQLARHILLQRITNGDDHSSVSADLPDAMDRDRALTHILEFGREPAHLFSMGRRDPSLVLMLEGTTDDNIDELKKGLERRGQRLSFVIDDPPSAKANQELADRDFLGVASKCSDAAEVEAVLRPGDKKCWQGASLFAKYDVARQPSVVSNIVSNLDSLLDSVDNDMQAIIVLMPESSRTAGSKEWTTQQADASELRRRQFESVLGEKLPKKSGGVQTSSSGVSHLAAGGAAPNRRIPACFASLSACQNATAGCSGHGECLNKFTGTNTSVAKGDPVCFSCHCLPTKEGNTRAFWGGKTCQKRDISTPFWLITFLTVALIGLVSMAIGMLFTVGEEKLPGVIGAGVSRPGK
ncbi:hypothetical protein MAPG_01219 [Magnaporthiopsis poae ATCC 64411]|uniref:Vacuolar sorting protein Vps3844 C-terminal domain-containing protein n=1 Tax=Magnaporthiopsis poae (strain ATCC 64411 / 73-15) TaxID=644358 RepID=A0A0C4DN45_MAGP6|nr:hypothetical protein MAPG_01219 [Magnaporthiopsis poae ATCC 64411]